MRTAAACRREPRRPSGGTFPRCARSADNRLRFHKFLKPEDPAFPPDPRLFESTEGSKRIVTQCIDHDPAGRDLPCYAICPFRIGRAYVRDETELRVVGY